ncbi:MAG: recombinase family protein [Paracoccaceae bacterium]
MPPIRISSRLSRYIYKIDRLTRALADFARMLEIFDRHQVSFVSVTQSFNTTSSMGRLTLNVLLSFAQFEREVTGERIRDKIAASKQKGLWIGGTVPLGYDLPPPGGERVLVLNPAEAETVRLIFRRYLDLGSVPALLDWLNRQGIRSKQHVSRKGKLLGGRCFSRGALFYLLRNRIYRGEIPHKGKTWPGRHEAIVDADLFEAVQRQLAAHAGRHRGQVCDRGNMGADATAWLTGRIRDGAGQGMSPAAARGRGGKRYRYYVSQGLQQGRIRRDRGEIGGQRIPAPLIEARVAEILHRLDLPGAEVAWPNCIALPSTVPFHVSYSGLVDSTCHDQPARNGDADERSRAKDHPGTLSLSWGRVGRVEFGREGACGYLCRPGAVRCS